MSKTPVITPIQELFCQHYVDLGCKNGTEAARRAGVKACRQYSSDTLGKPYIKARIARLKKKQGKRVEVVLKAEEVTRESMLREMAVIFRNAKNDTGDRITAGKTLGKWLGLEDKAIDPFAGDDPFAGKTETELDYYAIHGRFPAGDASHVN